MPNHCYQSVYIKGPSALVYELYHNLEYNRFCDVVLPIPFAKSTGMTGYDWRVDHWGTKWDVADVEIDNGGLEFSDEEAPEEVAWFSFKCWTAWSPPIPVWAALHALGIEVEADYEDEGGDFEGQWINGEDNCWEPVREEAV